jgi:serine phosphatase RsbU (regulator of sigma subunit)
MSVNRYDHPLASSMEGELAALRRSVRTYRALFDSLDEGFCILERSPGRVPGQLDFRYIAANPALEAQSGVTDVVGRTMRELLPDEPEDWYDIFDRVLTTGRSVRFQQSLASYGRVLELFAYCVDTESRDQIAVVFTDVTAQTRAEAHEQALLAELSRVAITLQRAILGPTILPPGFAARYEPATTLEVGGDWYDLVDLPAGRFGVVVGDVVGHGLAAAAVMGQLRSAGRALLLEDHGPASMLTSLDRFATLLAGAQCSTVFCAIINPATGALDYGSAGHLPAITVDAQGDHQLLDDALTPPLAVGKARVRTQASTILTAGSTLMLYTDGLIERRREDLDIGMNRARTALATHRDLAPEEVAGRLVHELLDPGHDDDVAFLLYRQPAHHHKLRQPRQ